MIRVDKTGHGLNYDVTARGKRSIALNLKKEEGADILRNNMTINYYDFLHQATKKDDFLPPHAVLAKVCHASLPGRSVAQQMC